MATAPPELTPKQSKTSMIAIVAIYCVLPLILLLVSSLIADKPKGEGQLFPDMLVYGVGVVSLVSSLSWAATKLSPTATLGGKDLTPIREFQTNVVIALAVSEFGVLFGFVAFLSNEAKLLPLVGATIAVNALLIWPRVAAFWRLYEDQNGPL